MPAAYCLGGYPPKKENRYQGKIYQNGKFDTPEDGVYHSAGFTHSFKVEKGWVFLEKSAAYLTNNTEKAFFYQTDIDGSLGQKVYVCDLAKLNVNAGNEGDACLVALDGTYNTKTGVSFTTKNGFLGDACYYDNQNGVVCEDRD